MPDDILSQGRDQPPGPPWRRAGAVAVVLAVAAVLLGLHLSGRHPAKSLSGQAAHRTPAATIADGPDGVTGPTLPWPPTLWLPVSGARPAWYAPAIGRTEVIGGLPDHRAGYQFTRVGGGWAIQPEPTAHARCGSCAVLPSPVYFLSPDALSARPVGLADSVAPAARPGRLWLTSYPAGANTNTASGTAQQVSLSGARIGAPVRLPAGYQLEQATTRGLLLAAAQARFLLWDGADRRTFRSVIAVDPGHLAWTPPCGTVCRVRVITLATGATTVITLPKGSTAASGAFSPDGRLLALQVSYSTGSAGGSLAMQLEVAGTTTGRLTAVPGTWASSDALVGFGWPGAGDSLVAEFGFTTKVQLASWRPGTTRLAVTTPRGGEPVTSMIVG
jgi:hypothetical protein